MKRNRRSTGRGAWKTAKPVAEVVSLLDDDDDDHDSDHTNPAPAAGTTATVKKVAVRAAKAAPAGAKDAVYSMEYGYPSSDDEPAAAADDNDSDSDWQQPASKPQQADNHQPAKRQCCRKRHLQNANVQDIVQEAILQSFSECNNSKRSAGAAAAALDNGAAAARSCKSPALNKLSSKRTNSGTKGAIKPGVKATTTEAKSAAAAGRRKGSAGNAARGAKQTKQTTLQLVQSKAFGSLCFSASQPAALSQSTLQFTATESQGSTIRSAVHNMCPCAAGAAASGASQPATGSVAASAASTIASCQWSDKHEPSNLDQLMVHKRKVAEVQAWLQGFLDAQATGHCPTRVLLVTGPPGCGKSVTLHVLAESMGFELTEWHAPVPTLWQDYQYQAGAGVSYSSKLDEFNLFVARCKFAALPLTCSSSSKPQPSQPPSQQQPSQPPSQQQQEPLLPSMLLQSMPPPKRRLPQLQSHCQQATQQQQQDAGLQQDQQLPLQLVQQLCESQPAQKHSLGVQQQPSQQQQYSKSLRPKARPKLLLIDDLPYVGDNAGRARLAASLADLASTARCPVVVVATTQEGGSGSSNYASYGSAAAAGMTTKGLHRDLLAVLEHAGATTISFNPITANTMTKVLQSIADKEGLMLDPDAADGIAQAAAGDLRNAIQSLQMLLLQQKPTTAQPAGKGKAKAPRKPRRNTKDPEAAAASAQAKQKVAGQVARDQHLSVYHAIGKLLHHKRQISGAQQQQADQPSSQQQQPDDSDIEVIDPAAAAPCAVTVLQQVHNRWWRPPLQVNPEAIIQGSGLEALQVTAFLAENYPHFFAEDAMEQAATTAAYLSDAGYLACHRSPVVSSSAGFWNEDDAAATTLQASAASSIAARGLLFANTHPAPSRWLPLRGPSCFVPDKAATGNLQQLGATVQQMQDSWQAAGPAKQQTVTALAGQLMHTGRQERAAQVLPFLQVLARQQSRSWVINMLPKSWYHVWNGAVTEQSSSHVHGPQAAAALQAAVAAALVDKGNGEESLQQSEREAAVDDAYGIREEIESDDD